MSTEPEPALNTFAWTQYKLYNTSYQDISTESDTYIELELAGEMLRFFFVLNKDPSLINRHDLDHT